MNCGKDIIEPITGAVSHLAKQNPPGKGPAVSFSSQGKGHQPVNVCKTPTAPLRVFEHMYICEQE